MQTCDGRGEGNLLVLALRVQAITIHGDGQQTRSFCTVDGQVHMIATGRQNSGPIHHGNPGAITIKPLAEEVNRLSGSSSTLVAKPLPQDDPRQRRPDSSLAASSFGWKPAVALTELLTRTIDSFRLLLGHRPDTIAPARASAVLYANASAGRQPR